MKFEIKREVDFKIEDLASSAIEIVNDNFSESVPNYEALDDEQRDELLKAIFRKALEIF